MNYFGKFICLLISFFFIHNNSIASLIDEESPNHEGQLFKSSSPLLDMDTQSVEESSTHEKLLLKSSSPLLDIDTQSVEKSSTHGQLLLKSFPPLVDMGEDIVIKAFSFVSDCTFRLDQGIIEPEKDVYFISPLKKGIIENIRQKENYSQFQYFFVTEQGDVIDTLRLVKNFKEDLNLNLDNQIKVIIFSPLGLEKPKAEYNHYNKLISKQNMISFILQYSWYSGQISRTCCPLGVSIDIPSDKHSKGFRLSKLNPFDSCIGRSQSCEQLGFFEETLRDIYGKVLYRWNFRMDGIENGAFRDEDDALDKIGIYSANPVGNKLIAFLGGYGY